MKRIPLHDKPKKKGKKHRLSPAALEGARRANAQKKALGIANPSFRDLMVSQLPNMDEVPDFVNSTRAPLFYTRPGLYEHIMSMLREGHHISAVCRACGIDDSTFVNWLKKGRKGRDKVYLQFLLDVRAAEAQAEINRFNKLKEHENDDWKVSAWILERRYPERYGRKPVDSNGRPTTVNINGDKVLVKNELAARTLDDEELREEARKLIAGGPRLLPAGGSGASGDEG